MVHTLGDQGREFLLKVKSTTLQREETKKRERMKEEKEEEERGGFKTYMILIPCKSCIDLLAW